MHCSEISGFHQNVTLREGMAVLVQTPRCMRAFGKSSELITMKFSMRNVYKEVSEFGVSDCLSGLKGAYELINTESRLKEYCERE
jgi:hypothetical protein